MSIWIENWISCQRASKVSIPHSRSRFCAIIGYLLTETVYEDPDAPSGHIQNLESENAALQGQIDMLQRELQSRSPTKSSRFAALPQTPQRPKVLPPGYQLISPQRSCEDSPRISNRQPLHSTRLSARLQGLTLSDGGAELGNKLRIPSTPTAKPPGTGGKVRKFTARKWVLADENELDGF